MVRPQWREKSAAAAVYSSVNSFFIEKQYEKYAFELSDSLITSANTSNYETIMQEVLSIKARQQNQDTLLAQIFKCLDNSSSMAVWLPVKIETPQ